MSVFNNEKAVETKIRLQEIRFTIGVCCNLELNKINASKSKDVHQKPRTDIAALLRLMPDERIECQ